MRTKLLSFLGLVVASISLSLIFGSAPVFAAGEKYKWIDENTIQASGGLYKDVNAAKDGVLNLKHSTNNNYTAFSDGGLFGCDLTLTLTVGIDNKTGKLKTEGCTDEAKDFDRNVTVTNVAKGPKPDGADIDYTKVNCSEYYEGGDNVYRCEAVKKCVKDKKGTALECLNGYNACIVEKVPNGIPKVEDYNACKDKISGGDLSDADEPDASEGDETSCAIDGIGWILCPVLTFLGQVTDAAYSFVSALLEVQPILTTGASKETYEAWSIMRNFANVAFVIAFVVIIFSQVTSVGISNYGIKRMLPRLIIAAILVNISYWICAIAVDVSNIFGASMKALFDSMKAGISVPEGGTFSGGGWAAGVGAVIAGGTAVGVALYVGLAALIPALIAALIAIITVFLVLTLRQALIILLVVVSPLAFVAYLLPNTENWFKQWRKLFGRLLAMYVIIAFIFGGSALASKIVIASSDNMAVQVAGAAVAVIPLFITPIVMKAGGGALAKFGVNNINKGPLDSARRGAEGYAANRRILRQSRALNGVGYSMPGYKGNLQRKMRRDAINASRASGLNSAKTRYLADAAAAQNPDGTENQFARQMAGGSRFVEPSQQAQAAVIAGAINQQKKALSEDVKDMEALVRVRFDNPDQALKEAMEKGDSTMAVAAQNVMFAQGGSGIKSFRNTIQGMEQSIANARNSGDNETADRLQGQLSSVSSELKRNVSENHGKYAKEKGNDILAWSKSTSGASLTSSTAVAPGKALSDNELVGQHDSTLAKMEDSGLISSTQASRMLSDPRVDANIDDAKRAILERIKNGQASPNTGVPPRPSTAPTPAPTPAPLPPGAPPMPTTPPVVPPPRPSYPPTVPGAPPRPTTPPRPPGPTPPGP